MAGGVELATAYVSLVVEGSSIRKEIRKQFGVLGKDAKKSGTQAGSDYAGGMKSRMSSLGKSIFAPLAAAGAAVGVKDFLGSAVEEARDSQKVGALTTQVIKSTGGAAKVSAAQVGDLATAISNKTGIDDESIQSGANMLLTFKNIRNEAGKGNDIFSQSTSILTDMSSAMGTEPKQAAIQLGKALNDPIKGVTALSKVGVTFTDQQKKTIKSLVNGGKTAEAQKIILKELNSEFGGAAAAQATAGEKMSTAWGNLKEQIGTALLPVIDKVESFMTEKAIPAVSQFIAEMQSGTGRGGAFVDKLRELGDKAQQVGDWIKSNVVPPIKEFIQQFKDGEGTGGKFRDLLEKIGNKAKEVGNWIKTDVVPQIKEFIQQFKDGEGSGGKFRSLLEKIGAAVSKAFGWLSEHPGVVKTFMAGFAGLYTAKKALDGAASGIGAIKEKIDGVKEKFDTVKEGIQSAKDAAASAKETLTNLKNGIQSAGTAAKNGAKWVKDFGAGQKIASAATKVWTGIQAAFNLVMDANPIVLIVIGLVALGVALVIAYKKSETFRNIVNGAFSKIKSIVSGVVNWFKSSFVPFFTKTIPNAFQSVLNFVKSHWKLILGLITGPIGAAVLLVTSNWDKIKGAFSKAWNWVKSTFKSAWNGLKSIISKPVDLARSAISSAISRIKGAFNSVWSWATGTFRSTWNGLKSIISKPVNLAKSLIDREINGVKTIFSKAKDAIGAIWNGLKDKITAPIRAILSWIGKHFVDPINSVLSKVGVGLRIPWPSFSSGGGVGHGGGHVAPTRAFASGGVLPGYSPGTDNMHFVGPHGGLSLSGGEAIMRPEWTRAIGAQGINAMNAAARTGGVGGVRKMLGGQRAFSIGGIIGDTWDKAKGAVGKVWDGAKFMADLALHPIETIKKIANGLLGGISGNMWGQTAKGALTSAVGGIGQKVKDFFTGGGAGGGTPGSKGGKGGRGWQWQWNLIHSMFPGVSLTSAYRAGAHTAGSGAVSYHALGRAIDLGGSVPELSKVAKWILANFGASSHDLLYSPLWGDMGLYEGKWHKQPAVTVADHRNHVHWGFGQGGVLPDAPVFDNGGTLAPGYNLVNNKTGGPEPLVRADRAGLEIHHEAPIHIGQVVAADVDDFERQMEQRRRMSALSGRRS